MGVDHERAAAAVEQLLAALGEDPSRPELAQTPRLVVEALSEYVAGRGVDARAHLTALEPAPSGGEPVVVTNLAVRSLCEHHLMPFIGVAHLAYVPERFVTGLGNLNRVVQTIAAKPQIQERLTQEVADVLVDGLGARGVLVVLDMAHQCVRARGAQQTESRTITIASRGTLTEGQTRSELMALIGAADG
jgi:GTP cyclohydrolase IA